MNSETNDLVTDVRLRALREIGADDRLYFLRVAEAPVLFRIDGMVLQTGPVIFDLCETWKDDEPAERIQRAQSVYGEGEAADALDELVDLCRRGIVGSNVPNYIPRGVVKNSALSGILIMVTQTCNLACVYCYAGAGTYGQPTKYQTAEQALGAIDYLVANSGNRKRLRVTFFGGEPLLGFHIIKKVVAYCSEVAAAAGKAFDYSITTNGTIVNDDILQLLKEHRFTVLVSFDGIPEMHDKYRPTANGGASYEAVRSGIAAIVAAGIPVNLRGTLVKEMVNEETMRRIAQTAEELGAGRISLSAVDCLRNPTDEYALSPEDSSHYAEISHRITLENIENAGKGKRPVLDSNATIVRALAKGDGVGMGNCGACGGMSAVATNGKIYPCHRFVGMEPYAIGDMASGGIDDGLRQQFFERFNEAGQTKCQVCMARLLCGGMCYFSVADKGGGFMAPPEEACENIRGSLKRAIGYLMLLQKLPREHARTYLTGVQTWTDESM